MLIQASDYFILISKCITVNKELLTKLEVVISYICLLVFLEYEFVMSMSDVL